jgi:hypothetical protein
MNYSSKIEALREASRLTKMTGREIDARTVDCECDYYPHCYMCSGSGCYFELFYLSCGHAVQDDDRDETECVEADCAEREKVNKMRAERDRLSIPESIIDEELEAVR